jgi:O-antigen ligase
MVILIYLFINHGYVLWEKIIAGMAMILFSAEIILLESRAGILAFASILTVYLFYILFFKRKFLLPVLVGVIFIGVAFAGIYKLVPKEINRIQDAIDYVKVNYISDNSSSDTYVRFLIWDASAKVGLHHLPFGVGTGDVKDELKKQYQEEGYVEPYESNFNAHCQYLQLFVVLGIPGSILFLLILFSSIWIGCKRENILFILFGIITDLNFLVESMLEKQAGVMFFVFFFTILYFVSQTQLLKQNPETLTLK